MQSTEDFTGDAEVSWEPLKRHVGVGGGGDDVLLVRPLAGLNLLQLGDGRSLEVSSRGGGACELLKIIKSSRRVQALSRVTTLEPQQGVSVLLVLSLKRLLESRF